MTVGGKNININEYTMTAGLLDSSDMTIFCDATIISDQYVLTAAHCIVSRNISMIHVIVGAHNMLEGSYNLYSNDGEYFQIDLDGRERGGEEDSNNSKLTLKIVSCI